MTGQRRVSRNLECYAYTHTAPPEYNLGRGVGVISVLRIHNVAKELKSGAPPLLSISFSLDVAERM